jgi:pyrimidine nucleoside transport protein
VLWGFLLQFVFAMLVLRWKYGYIAIRFLSDEIIKFIFYGFEGAATVFGDPWLLFHPFAFIVSLYY